jgi:tRNA(Ile)-lysidine synthase
MQDNRIHFVSEEWRGDVLNNEEEARFARYEFLKRKCFEMKIQFLATGHHADDQVETFFINLSRGSALDGLTGMPKIRELANVNKDGTRDKLFLIRPVLSFSKNTCVDFLNNLGIKFCEDASNFDTRHLRNKIRLILKEIGDYELIRRRITNCIESLQGARNLIEKTIEKSIISISKIESAKQKNVNLLQQKLLLQNVNNYVIFSLEKFIKLTLYEQYSILNSTLQRLEGKNEKIRKSFLTIFLQDIEQARRQKSKLKRNTANVNLTADGKLGLICFAQS